MNLYPNRQRLKGNLHKEWIRGGGSFLVWSSRPYLPRQWVCLEIVLEKEFKVGRRKILIDYK